MMHQSAPETLREQWTDLLPQLQDRWPELDEEELEQVDGDLDRLVKLIVDRYGLTRAEVMNELTMLLTPSEVTTS